MLEKIIFHSLILLAVTFALTYLNKALNKAVFVQRGNEYFLRMNKLYYYVGMSALIIVGVFIVVPPLVATLDWGMVIAILIFSLIFGGLGLICFLYYKNHYLLFDSSKIEVRSVYGKIAVIKWKDIKGIKFNATSGLLILTDNFGTTIKVHQHLVGLSVFIQMVEAKTIWTARSLNFPTS